jgi:hypothetical protein
MLLGIGDKPNNQDFQDSNGVFISDNTFTHLLLTYSTASRNSGFSLIVKSDYKKPFKIFFESPLFHDTVVEILFAFDIERSIALGTEGGKEYSLIWISEFCLKDDAKLKSRLN